MGALNTKRVFFIPALAPAMLNITLIMSIIWFESKTRQPIIAAAIGVLVEGLYSSLSSFLPSLRMVIPLVLMLPSGTPG